MKKFTKILSIFCSLAILFSCIGVGFTASAAQAVLSANATYSCDENKSYESVYGKNMLAGSSIDAAAYENIGGTITPAGTWTPGQGLVDNSPAAQQTIQVSWPSGAISNSATAAQDRTSTNKYLDYTFTLAGPINNPQKVLLTFTQYGSSPNWNNTFPDCGHYAIYASSSKETLFSSQPIYYHSRNYAGYEHLIDISALELKNVKYFGVRVYNFYYWGSTVLFSEMALYGGTSIVSNSNTASLGDEGTYDSNKELGVNLLNGSTISAVSVVDGAAPVEIQTNDKPYSVLTDGLVSTGRVQWNGGKWNENFTMANANENTYVQATFNLSNEISNPEKFLIAHNRNSEAGMECKWYTIYASNSLENLYASPIYTHKSETASYEQIVDISDFNLESVKYFGIRFYYLIKGVYATPAEIGLYGGKVTCIDTNDYATIYDHATSFENGNWLSSATYSSAAMHNGSSQTLTYAGDHVMLTDDRAYDRTMLQATGITDSTNEYLNTTVTTTYYDATFTLANPIDNPDSFIIAHDKFQSTNPNAPFVSQWYDIYAADTLENLNSSAPIYTYKNNTKYAVQLVDISGKNLKNIKYFRVRFYHMPLYGNCIIPSEIGLYGGKLTPSAIFTANNSFTSDANNSYNTVYGENVLANGTLTAKAVNNEAIVKTFNPSGLTDGSSYTMNMMQAKENNETLFPSNPSIEDNLTQKDVYIELTWNFSESISFLEKVLISHTAVNSSQNTNFTSKHYSIYASTSTADLYNDENLIVEYSNNSRVGLEHLFDISSFELKDIKAFGIRYYEMEWGDCIIPSEIGLYCGIDPDAVSLELKASVFNSKAGQNSNDIQYKAIINTDSTLLDLGIISGFKVNIDADENFTGDYAEYLKSEPETVVKVSAKNNINNPNLYFHITNSGTKDSIDYSGYRLVTMAYAVIEVNGEEITYYSNIINKSSMQISRNQAKSFKEANYKIEGFENYAFATDATIDISVVRNYVEAVSPIMKRSYAVSMDNELINVQGRAYPLKNGVAVDHSAGGIEFKADCQGDVSVKVKVRLTSISADNDPPKFAFTVDGSADSYYECPNVIGNIEYDIVIAKDLARGIHEFGIYKYNGFNADIISVTVGGKLVENDYAKRPEIHFYGSSSTRGHYSVITVDDGVNPVLTDLTGVYDPINNPDAILRVMIAIKDNSGNVVYENRMAYYAPSDSTNHIFYLEDGTQIKYPKSSYTAHHRFYGYNTATGEADRLMREVVYGTGVKYTTSGRNSYTSYMAKALNANYDIYAISGGSYQSMTNNYYVDTRNGGTYTPTPADIVVVNHCNNSMYKEGNDYAGYMKKTVENIRKVSPDAAIIFVYGFHVYDGLGTYKDGPTGEMYSTVEHNAGIVKTVNEMRETDSNVYALKLSVARDGGVLNHPSLANMKTIADELVAFVNANDLLN